MSGFELPGMTRPRRSSATSEDSTGTVREQELGSMYDYLAKVILLGPSGTGKWVSRLASTLRRSLTSMAGRVSSTAL